jgi:hypothetical protein
LKSDNPAPEALQRLIQMAFLVRVAAVIVLSLLGAEDIFAPDHETYHFFSGWLARYWSGETLGYPWKLLEPGPKAYYYIVASLYSVFGEYEIVPKLVNAAMGAWSVRLVYDVARRMSNNEDMAIRAARYATFFPSLILWSAVNIRDCWVIMLILLICKQAMMLQERVNVRSAFILAAAIGSIIQFRDYIFFAVTVPAAVSFPVRNRAHLLRNTLLGMIVAVVIIYADQSAGANRPMRSIDLETLDQIRQGTAVGGSKFQGEADISTPTKAALFLPQGLAFFLLAPFPWSITGLRQTFTLPEMLFFYSLLPAMVRGIAYLVRTRIAQSLMVLLVTGGLTLGYALGEANAGTAYRHRAQVLSFYLIFAAVGVQQRRDRAAELAQPAVA